MTFDRTRPDTTAKVRAADDNLRDNWAAIADAIGREHVFDGDSSSDEGQHLPGRTGIVYVGPASAASGANATLGCREGAGALVYCTDTKAFLIWDGGKWVERKFLKTAGDTISHAWTVGGAYIDGRDPSVDGTKLDTCSASSDYCAIARGTVADGGTIPEISGFDKTDCAVIAHNCGIWSLAAQQYAFRIRCIVNATTWAVTSDVTYHMYGLAVKTQYPTAYYMVVGRKHT